MVTIVIPSNIWEDEYIKNDILNGICDKSIYYNKTNFEELYNLDGLQKYIFVINADISYEWYKKLFSKVCPTIIIFLGDECGNQIEYIRLSSYCKLFLKQYNHNYDISQNNLYQIPLGYVNEFIDNNSSIDTSNNSMHNREKIWSFVGEIKGDRINMLNHFIEAYGKQSVHLSTNNWKIKLLKVSPQEVHNKYNNSLFVPIGRGNFSLDCYRIYEAIVSGALPIVCGSPEELKVTFDYDTDYPPFLFVSSWVEAIKKCNFLLKNPEKLNILQQLNLNWWKNKIYKINKKVLEALK